jgi:hypothetical protein
MAHQAQDTFVAQMDDGSMRYVTKGEVLPDKHELVKRDQAGTGLLFRPLDLDGEEAAPKSGAKAAGPEAAPAPVKTARRAG